MKHIKSFLEARKSKSKQVSVELTEEQRQNILDICLELDDCGVDYHFVDDRALQPSNITQYSSQLAHDFGAMYHPSDLWIVKKGGSFETEDGDWQEDGDGYDEFHTSFRYTYEINEVMERIKDYLNEFNISVVFIVNGTIQNPKVHYNYDFLELQFTKK